MPNMKPIGGHLPSSKYLPSSLLLVKVNASAKHCLKFSEYQISNQAICKQSKITDSVILLSPRYLAARILSMAAFQTSCSTNLA